MGIKKIKIVVDECGILLYNGEEDVYKRQTIYNRRYEEKYSDNRDDALHERRVS